MDFPITDKTFVESIIPQKWPFAMVDSLLFHSDKEVISGLTIVEENIFTNNAFFQESGLIEHMAQTIALHTGYLYFLKNEPAPTGYIGSIKSIEIERLPKLGEKIETTVTILHEMMGVTLVEISSKINNIEIAKGQMKTVLA